MVAALGPDRQARDGKDPDDDRIVRPEDGEAARLDAFSDLEADRGDFRRQLVVPDEPPVVVIVDEGVPPGRFSAAVQIAPDGSRLDHQLATVTQGASCPPKSMAGLLGADGVEREPGVHDVDGRDVAEATELGLDELDRLAGAVEAKGILAEAADRHRRSVARGDPQPMTGEEQRIAPVAAAELEDGRPGGDPLEAVAHERRRLGEVRVRSRIEGIPVITIHPRVATSTVFDPADGTSRQATTVIVVVAYRSPTVIRRHIVPFRLSLMAADALAAMAVFVGLSIIRFGVDGWLPAWARLGVEAVVLTAAWAAVWVAALWVQGLYRLRARWTLRAELLDLARGTALLAVVTFSLLFIFKLPEVSRLFLILLFPVQAVVTFASRLGLRLAFRWARMRGLSARFVLVVGTGQEAQAFADRIERHRELGLRVVGHLAWRPDRGPTGIAPTPRSEPALRRPILGGMDDIEDVLHATVVDEVVVCLPPAAWGLVEAITRLCEDEGKIVRIPMLEGTFDLPGAHHEEFDGIPVLSLVYGPDRILGMVGKRLLDVTLAGLAITMLAPVLAGVALLVRILDGSPVLFRQARVGLHGREFRVVKFRTMVPDAEERLDELLEHNEISGHAFKLTDDPRLSRTGRWLRRMSLDELPQLWNVLRGEMSLVGPRPPLPREVAGYDVWHRRRLSMKPGITGLWQVSGRREEEFDRWVAMDLDYIDRWSLWLDLKIMVRTIPAMLQGR